MKLLLSQCDNNIILPEGIKVEIVDDVNTSQSISIVLKANTSLIYNFKSVDESIDKNIIISLEGEGATCDIKLIYKLSDFNKCKLTTVQHHKASNTKSNLIVKGVISDNASLIANNLIRIEKSAQLTQAEELTKGLLLSDNARVVAIPNLEVEANDVSAKHGAAISQLDKESIFYLQSRGMDLQSAKQFLIEGFISE